MHGKNAETIKTSDPAHFTSGFLDRHSSASCAAGSCDDEISVRRGKISAAVTVIYLGSAFLGGRIAGRRTENKKYLWGLLAGMCYFAVLFLLTLILKRNIDPSSIQTITTACLCMGGGMLGGMLAF